jgi:outer membrane protein
MARSPAASLSIGVGSITDLTLEETQLLQAKSAPMDAYSGALSTAATLTLSTGTLGAAPSEATWRSHIRRAPPLP